MMAAVQPFVSGAISKTVNLPNAATVEDVSDIYTLGWRLGLKAIAIYRDGSKRTQPLSTTAARVAEGRRRRGRGRRCRCAAGCRTTAPRMTHKFSVGGQEGYITVGLYDDGSPGEVFVKMSKQGSTVSGLMDSVAIAWSMALQHGVPVESLISKYIDHRFEPSGFTGQPADPDGPLGRGLPRPLDGLALPLRGGPADRRRAARWPSRRPRPRRPPRTCPDDQLSFGEVAAPAEGADGDGARSKLVLQSTGQICTSCGSSDLVRSGTCLTCRTCGATSGCG